MANLMDGQIVHSNFAASFTFASDAKSPLGRRLVLLLVQALKIARGVETGGFRNADAPCRHPTTASRRFQVARILGLTLLPGPGHQAVLLQVPPRSEEPRQGSSAILD